MRGGIKPAHILRRPCVKARRSRFSHPSSSPPGEQKVVKMVSVILEIHKYIWLVLRHSGNTEFRKAVIT